MMCLLDSCTRTYTYTHTHTYDVCTKNCVSGPSYYAAARDGYYTYTDRGASVVVAINRAEPSPYPRETFTPGYSLSFLPPTRTMEKVHAPLTPYVTYTQMTTSAASRLATRRVFHIGGPSVGRPTRWG